MNIFTNFMLAIGAAGMIIVIFFNHLLENNEFLKVAVPIASIILLVVGIWVVANNKRNQNKVD